MNRFKSIILTLGLVVSGTAYGADTLQARDLYYREVTIDPGAEGVRATVLYFFANTCPVARRYFPRMAELHQTYAPKGVRVFGINASEADSLPDIVRLGLEHEISFPLLKDADFRLVQAFAVSRTPEVVVLDSTGTVRYQGRIDNQYRLGGAAPSAGRPYLAEALDALLDVRDVAEPRTQAEGCAVTLPYQSATREDPARTRGLLTQYCLPCHAPEEMRLATPTALGRARDAVAVGFMPPRASGIGDLSDPERFQLIRGLRDVDANLLADLGRDGVVAKGDLSLPLASLEQGGAPGIVLARFTLDPGRTPWIQSFHLGGNAPAFGWVTYFRERAGNNALEYLAGPAPAEGAGITLPRGQAIAVAPGDRLLARIAAPDELSPASYAPVLQISGTASTPDHLHQGRHLDWSGTVGAAEVAIGALSLPAGTRLVSVHSPVSAYGYVLRITFTADPDTAPIAEDAVLLDPRFPARLALESGEVLQGPGTLHAYLARAAFCALPASSLSVEVSLLVASSVESDPKHGPE